MLGQPERQQHPRFLQVVLGKFSLVFRVSLIDFNKSVDLGLIPNGISMFHSPD
jgi:hypothetical protein